MVNHMAFVNGLCVKHCITSAYKQPQNQCLQPVFLIVVLNIVSTSVIIHAKTSLFQNDLCSTISFQMPSKYTIYRPCFHFSAVPNRLKCLQNVFIFFFYSFRLYRMLSEGIMLRPCSHVFL